MSKYSLIIVFLFASTTLRAQCTGCAASLSGSGTQTVPAGQTWCANGTTYANTTGTLTVNGTLKICGAADVSSSSTLTVGTNGQIQVFGCPTRVTFSGFLNSNATSNPLVYTDCSCAAARNGSTTAWNGGTGSRVNLCNAALPILLLNFQGKNEGPINTFLWSTQTEHNNDFFTLERSIDLLHFEPIGTVKGAGNSSYPIQYSFIENNPLQGIYYYRLKQTDYDGQFTYSSVISLSIHQYFGFKDLIYPNPANDRLFIHLKEATNLTSIDMAKITITDALGKIHKIDILAYYGGIIEIETSSLLSGLYIVSITINERFINAPISIHH